MLNVINSHKILIFFQWLKSQKQTKGNYLRAKLSRSPRSWRKHSGRLGKDLSSFFRVGGLRIPIISFLMLVLSLCVGLAAPGSSLSCSRSPPVLSSLTSLKHWGAGILEGRIFLLLPDSDPSDWRRRDWGHLCILSRGEVEGHTPLQLRSLGPLLVAVPVIRDSSGLHAARVTVTTLRHTDSWQITERRVSSDSDAAAGAGAAAGRRHAHCGLGVRHYSRCARAECRRTTELGGSWGRAAAGHKPDHRKYPPDTAHTKMEPGPFYM